MQLKSSYSIFCRRLFEIQNRKFMSLCLKWWVQHLFQPHFHKHESVSFCWKENIKKVIFKCRYVQHVVLNCLLLLNETWSQRISPKSSFESLLKYMSTYENMLFPFKCSESINFRQTAVPFKSCEIKYCAI